MKKIFCVITAFVIMLSVCSCGKAAEAPVYEAGPVPDAYREAAGEEGTLQVFTYESCDYAGGGGKIEKRCTVYTPFVYEDGGDRRYNILYLLHGAGGSEETYMGTPGEPRDLKHIIDNMIECGDIKPLIVVMPTVSESDEGEYFSGMTSFKTELREDLIPAVETEFSTYADGAEYEKSRAHRAFGGFSMGGYLVWDALARDADLFAWFLPMSCYYYGENADRVADASGGAALIADGVRESGYSADLHIFAASGSEDFLHEQTLELVESLCAYGDLFTYTDTAFEGGNISFYLGEGGEHGFRYSLEYIYNALPVMFR